jgi:phosphohistidine phosphatase SixA
MAIFTVALSFVSAANADTLSGASLIEHLRQGGYVLLMRHAHSPSAPPDKAHADVANVKLERQLDEAGRTSARAMGEALRKLRIPIGAVLSSPTYRALQTVQIAGLGAPKTFAQLGDGGHSMMAKAVSDQTNWLRGKTAERPATGSNTVIVTHMPNIQAAFGQTANDLMDGETLVFRPNGHDGVEFIAKVKIDDWPALSKETSK